MVGKDVIKLISRFVDEIEIDVYKFHYDGNVFGNYDIGLQYKKIRLTLNCDRGIL